MQHVTFEMANKLKEKGYPQHIRDHEYIIDNEYEDKFEIGEKYPVEFIPEHIPSIAAPRISEVLKWLREYKEIDIVPYPIDACTVYMGGEKYILSIYINRKRDYKIHHDNIDKYVTWEDAALAGINYFLKKEEFGE
jgi:hypothetical protein